MPRILLTSLHDAQAFEDSRAAAAAEHHDTLFPLQSRMQETSSSSSSHEQPQALVLLWDEDLVSVDELAPLSRAIIEESTTSTPRCLAVDSKTLLLGTSTGQVLAYDHFGVNRAQLAVSSSAQVGVSSVDSYQNALIVAGMDDGSVVLFENNQRVLEVMTPAGNAITTVKFLSRTLVVVVDCVGVAVLVRLSKVFLLGTFKCDKRLLLDGQEFGPGFAFCRLEGFGFAVSTLASTLIVRVDNLTGNNDEAVSSTTTTNTSLLDAASALAPPPPPSARIVSKWAAAPGGEASSSSSFGLAFHPQAMILRNRAPAFVVLRCTGHVCEALDLSTLLSTVVFTASSSVATRYSAVAFVSNSSAVLLDGNAYELHVCDLRTGQLLGRRNLTQVQFVPFAAFASHPDYSSFDNCVVRSGSSAEVYCLGLTELVRVGISPWPQRADKLAHSGQWMEALTLAMRHLAQSSSSSSSPTEERVAAELLTQYVFSNTLNQDIALVCIEYCLGIRREDLLFTLCFDAFAQVGATDALLEACLLVIVQGKFPVALPPHVYQLVCAHAAAQGDVLELLLLSLHELPLYDLDGCLRLCRERRMFSAACKLYTRVLGDFTAPCALAVSWLADNAAISHEEHQNLGYRFFLFLNYSLLGVEFPGGTAPLPVDKRGEVQDALLDFFFFGANQEEALRTCLEFDADSFLKIMQHCIYQSPDVYACLDKLMMMSDDNAGVVVVPVFVAQCLCAVKKPGDGDDLAATVQCAARVFSALYHHDDGAHHLPLLVELIQRYPGNLAWFEAQLLASQPPVADTAAAHVAVSLALARLQLKQHSAADANPAEYKQWMGRVFTLVLQQGDSVAMRDFIKSHHETQWLLRELITPHSQALVRAMSHDAELVGQLFELDPHGLLAHLSPDDQFRLLKPAIASWQKEVTLEMANTFVELLCRHEPAQAYDWLAKNEGRYNVEFALQQCTLHSIRNARAYLLERMGKVSEALDLVLEEEEDGDGDDDFAETRLPLAINLCRSFGSEQEWFKLLDACLRHRSSSSFHRMAAVETVLGAMMSAINGAGGEASGGMNAKAILQRVQRPQDMLHILQWFKREEAMWALARNVLRTDLGNIQHRVAASHARAVKLRAADLPPVSTTMTKKTPPRARMLVVPGFEDFANVDVCWGVTAKALPLAQGLVLGTEFELRLQPARSAYDMLQCQELVDAGL